MSATRKTPPDPTKRSTATNPNGKPSQSPANRNAWKRFGLLLLVGYLGLIVMVGFLQRWLMYPSVRQDNMDPLRANLAFGQALAMSFPSDDGLTLNGWHVQPAGQTATSLEQVDQRIAELNPLVVLFFHGNGGNRRHRTDEYQLLAKLKCHVIAVDYRGYGENPGSPTEAMLAADALACWRYLTVDRQIPANRILLVGESLGGGVATRLAAEVCEAGTAPAGLILRSTFSSMVDAALNRFFWLPVDLLILDRYLSYQQIPKVTCPILSFHGPHDQTVPIKLGQKLFAEAPEKSASGVAKKFVELPNSDHNNYLTADFELFRSETQAFLKQLETQAAKASPF